MAGLRKILESILNPGAAIGRGLALKGIDDSMAQAYVIGMMDKDNLKEMLQTIEPEAAEKIRTIVGVMDNVFLAMDVANMGEAIANFGPQTVLFELKAAFDSAGEVHTAHQAIIEIMHEAKIPGFEKLEFNINGKPVTVYIDASGHTNNHGQALSPETDYHAEFDRGDMSRAEIKAINAKIAEEISKTEASANNASSYDVSMKMLEVMDPELHKQLSEMHNKGFGTCLPDNAGITKDSPGACAVLKISAGGLY